MINQATDKQKDIVRIAFDDAIEQVKAQVDRSLSTSPYIIRGYTSHLTGVRGKFIRAASLLVCAQNEDGLIHPNAVLLAAAVELLHLATLVHDDVIDDAKTRRGVITLQKKYGKRTAVICGDYLFCMALELAASVPNKQDYLQFEMSDYMGKVCLGELNQHINNGNIDLTFYQYLRIIAGKTAALFEASFYAGAILCEDARPYLKQYRRLGRYIGMIFQLSDDCIDFEATENTAKKPVQSDYEQGVITLPLIYTFAQLNPFREKARAHKVSRAEINDAVSQSGGLGFTRAVSQKYHSKAMALIEELQASPAKKEQLTAILNKAFRSV